MPTRHARLAALSLLLYACGDDGETGDAGTGSNDASVAGSDTTDANDTDTTSTAATSSATTDADSTTGTTTTAGTATSDATTAGSLDDLPPTDSAAELEAWLAAGAYKGWPAESQIHASAGPHAGNVRTFVNLALAASLGEGAAMHPQGAASVKELHGAGTDAILGYAVMVKLAPDSAGGDGWYWYERLDATVYADDTGVGLCSGCHASGADYVLTPYPLP